MPDPRLRPSLPTSSSDFALPSSSSTSAPNDELGPILSRLRRPSLLAPRVTYYSEFRLSSPLATSFTLPLRHGPRSSTEESESDKERMRMDSSPSSMSENPTPPLEAAVEIQPDSGRVKAEKTRSKSPSTSISVDGQIPPKRPPRIRALLEEPRPEEKELEAEAIFQRLVKSNSELPLQPRTPRSFSDRGRYPEEVEQEEVLREETPSDDGELEDSYFSSLPATEPINIAKPVTPAQSVCGDDMYISESPGTISMDIDMVSHSPSISSTPAPNQWRATPPPTTSVVRSNKRKLDDRYDPYPSASKRRAVSPSLSHLRETHCKGQGSSGRQPIPISIPSSVVNSAASSPIVGNASLSSGVALSRPITVGSPSIMSSPTARATIGLASPILRPMRNGSISRRSEEKQVEGAGEGVSSLRLA